MTCCPDIVHLNCFSNKMVNVTSRNRQTASPEQGHLLGLGLGLEEINFLTVFKTYIFGVP